MSLLRVQSLVVKAADSGLLVCIPKHGIVERIFEEAEELGYVGQIGPYLEIAVYAANNQGKPTKRLLDVIIFDLEVSGASLLSLEKPAGVDPSAIPSFGVHQRRDEWPVASHLVTAAANFVQGGGNRLDAYFTAVEDGELPDPDDVGANASGGELPNGDGADSLIRRLLSQSEVTQRLIKWTRWKMFSNAFLA